MRKHVNSDSTFRENILSASKNNFSRIVLALDLQGSSQRQLLRRGKKLIEETAPYVCAIKLGRPTVLNLGMEKTRTLIATSHANELPCIIDDKLGDIDDVNLAISQTYFTLGFDGIIVNPIAGWKGGLEPVFKLARNGGKGVIVLVYMSNPGATEAFGQLVLRSSHGKPKPQYEIFAEKADLWGADGAVVGGNRPDIVKKVRAKLHNGIHIYSPGIGTQGGKVLRASKAGSDFFIIGRSITRSSDPERAVHNFARQSVS
ncbi:MAG TPA: orotidine 5'-phosphate decarboxylase / HUMPS family protein [Candidatus Bathyarchaeia archaeon]|nr:orotidine 5'-phosphate decarboxylase / HUMPS family protein [Candidatus Bathyarchaeia archaeon]